MSARLSHGHFEDDISGIGNIEWAIASGMSPSLNLWTMLLMDCFAFSFIICHLVSSQWVAIIGLSFLDINLLIPFCLPSATL